MNDSVIRPRKLEEFFLGLHKKFGKYIVLRGYENLPTGYSNDIDVYLPQREVKRFLYCLKNLDAVTADITILDSRLGLMKCELLLEGQSISFDILYGFYYVGLEYQNTQTLLNHSVIHKSGLFYVPAVEDEVRISVLKELLHNGRVRSDKAKYLGEMIPSCKDSLASGFFDRQAIDSVQKAIAEGHLDLPALSKRVKSKLLLAGVTKNIFGVIKNTCLFVLIKYLAKNRYHQIRFL